MAATQFIVEDAVNGFSVTPKETGKSGKYWNIALPHLLGSDPVNGGGLLFLMESMNGTERTSQISVQWNETFNSCRLGMAGKEQYLDVQLSNLGASRVPISVITPKTTSVGILDSQRGSSEDFACFTTKVVEVLFHLARLRNGLA